MKLFFSDRKFTLPLVGTRVPGVEIDNAATIVIGILGNTKIRSLQSENFDEF